MLTESFSLQDLSGFIEQLSKEGLMNPSTAHARKYACELILGALPAEEQRDISKVEVNQAYQRFVAFSDPQISLKTLETYRNRVASALYEMKRWKSDPEGYMVRLRQKTAQDVTRVKSFTHTLSAQEVQRWLAPIPQATAPRRDAAAAILPPVPVPLRDNLVVQVMGLPANLTRQEVQRILKVVEAYAD